MQPFALRFPSVAEWRGRLIPLALPLAMFVALLALGGDRGYFYREDAYESNIHNYTTARALAIAKNLSPDHNFRLAHRIWRDDGGGLAYGLYSRFPIGSFALAKLAILPFGGDIASELIAARVLALLMFCGAAALACLAVARIAGSRRIALVAVTLAFSGFYAVYTADDVSNESVMDVFGAALVFHGMVVFVQEGRFRQLLVKTCAALLVGWHVYALLLPFIALGLGGEAIALWRSAASGEKAKAARAAIIALVRSRYVALGAVSVLFGAALLAFNFVNEYAVYDAERTSSERTAWDSALLRFGLNADFNEQRGDELGWGKFIRRQFYRAGVSFVPYSVARAVGYDFETPEPFDITLAQAALGAAATVAALGALALARGHRLLLASAVLFGFCWGFPMRYSTFERYNYFEGVFYLWLALALFAMAMMGARRLLGERVGGRVSLGLCAAAALVFSLSVFHAGQRDRDAAEAEREKTEMAEISAIREITRGKSVEIFPYHNKVITKFRKSYYTAGSYYATGDFTFGDFPCEPRRSDFLISHYRDDSLNPLTPEHRFVFLYEGASPLDLCRAERRRLEASEPAARSVFDVYLQESSLTYLKAPCEPSDYEARFFAYYYPADPNDLPAKDRRNGYSKLRGWHAWYPNGVSAFDGACLMTLQTPDYPAAAIRAGQWVWSGERQWEADILWEAAIAPPPDAEARAFYEKTYQDIVSSGEPAARTAFDLYLDLDRNTLSYLKAPCGEDDARGRFFLSVHPVDVADLPEDRREIGHESLNFTFAPPAGAIFDGKCMATRQLPDYEIARIETGQWIPGGDRLWDAEIVVSD